jgi:hypothetical protein
LYFGGQSNQRSPVIDRIDVGEPVGNEIEEVAAKETDVLALETATGFSGEAFNRLKALFAENIPNGDRVDLDAKHSMPLLRKPKHVKTFAA